MKPEGEETTGSDGRGGLGLGSILAASHLALILAAVGLVGGEGLILLDRLAHQNALSRVRLAALGAVEAIERTGERATSAVLLLAERPTLKALLSSGDRAGMREYLESFRLRSRLSACAVFSEEDLIATAGPPLPWLEIEQETARDPQTVRFLESSDGILLMAVQALVPGSAGSAVLAVRFLDEAYLERTGGTIGLPLVVLSTAEIEAGGDDERSVLRRRGLLEHDEPAAEFIVPLGSYLSVAPLRDHGGPIVGIVEAELPPALMGSPLRAVAGRLIVLASAIALLGVLISLLLARRVARPLEKLTEAASRIGRGELSAPVPVTPGAEVGILSASMEEMRTRMLELMTELRRRQAEAQTILEGITEGVFSVDRERRIRYLNPQAAALLGVDSGSVLGMFCGDLLNPQGPGGVRPCEDDCPILHARFRGNTRAREQLLLAGGARRSVVISSSPTGEGMEEGGSGEVQQFQVLRDETDLEASRRLRDSVLANISHEFRSPLSAQLASLELLRDRLPELSPEQLQELVLSLERGTLRLTRLVDNLLESTRIEAGEIGLRRSTVMLDEVVEEAIGLVAPLIRQREQDLVVDLPYPLPPVQGDAHRLTQVMVNLLANANKFAPAGTTIAVGGVVADRDIEMWVEDEGPGLPAGTREAVFERFQRAPGDEPQETGMGLGLWIVKSIVERHGGQVKARSLKTGTRMSIVIPRG